MKKAIFTPPSGTYTIVITPEELQHIVETGHSTQSLLSHVPAFVSTEEDGLALVETGHGLKYRSLFDRTEATVQCLTIKVEKEKNNDPI